MWDLLGIPHPAIVPHPPAVKLKEHGLRIARLGLLPVSGLAGHPKPIRGHSGHFCLSNQAYVIGALTNVTLASAAVIGFQAGSGLRHRRPEQTPAPRFQSLVETSLSDFSNTELSQRPERRTCPVRGIDGHQCRRALEAQAQVALEKLTMAASVHAREQTPTQRPRIERQAGRSRTARC